MLAAKVIVEKFFILLLSLLCLKLASIIDKGCQNNGIPPCSFNISDNCCWIKAFDFHEDFYIPPQNLLPWWWWLWWRWWWWYWLSLLRRMRKMMVNMIWSSISDVLCPRSLWVKEYHNFIKVSCQDHTSIDQYFNSCQISLFRKQLTHILSNTGTQQQQQQQTNKYKANFKQI